MKRFSTYISFVIIPFLFAFCSDNPVTESPKEIRDLTPLEKTVVEKSNNFAFKIFREINKQTPGENVFISPLSLYMALGMTYNGADSETKEAMADVLDVKDLTDIQFNETVKTIIELLINLDPSVVMKIANSIWIKENFPVEDDFIATNQNYFNASVRRLNFSDPSSANIINNWVKENTAGYIEKVIENIPPQMVMYLINAIFFDAKWKYQFDKNLTYDADFTLPDGSVTNCKMMKQEKLFSVQFNDNFSAVDLPYGNAGFSMTILLPQENQGINSFINSITPGNWIDWMQSFNEANVVIGKPKYKFEYEVEDLKEALSQIGMEISFDPYRADFTRINKDGGLYIDEAIHKTYIEVDEEGTKAAAVTSIGVGLVSLPPAIILDRPFLFVIRENKSGTILFMGKVANPK